MKKKSEYYSGPASRQEGEGSLRPRAARKSTYRSSSDFVPPDRASQSVGSTRSSERSSDRPARSFSSDRPARSSDRPARSEHSSDRPARSFSSDRPARSSDRPARSERSSDRPTRSYSSDRAGRSYSSDRPARSSDRPARSERSSDRPTRSYSSDRPARSFSSDRPARSSDRPARSERSSDRPIRSYSSDRAGRSFSSDRPARSERSSDRPARSFSLDRPARSERSSDRPARSYSSDRTGRSYSSDRPTRSERPSYGQRSGRPSLGENLEGVTLPKGQRIAKLRNDLEQLEDGRATLNVATERNLGKSERMLQEAFGDSPIKGNRPKSGKVKTRPLSKARDSEGTAHQDALAWPMRLNRFVSLSGLCSRRTADELIEARRITINGKVANVLGTKVNQLDVVKYDDELLEIRRYVYVLLNKPKDYITTLDDPENRRTVMELVADATSERIVPAGRLDRNTTGLLLLTNDGELIQKLTHPSLEISKIYAVELDKALTQKDFNQVLEGFELEDGFIRVDALAWPEPRDKKLVGLSLHSGKNRIVRRIFEKLGYQVERLDRVSYAGLTKKDLPRGHWRYLTEKEVRFLRAGKKMV